MNKTSLILCLGLALLVSGQAWGARDIQLEIRKLHSERERLVEVRKALDKKLGELGSDLRTLDKALVQANQSWAAARKQWKKADRRVKKLEAKQASLKAKVKQLQTHMQQEADAAWKRANRKPSWLDIFMGVDVTEVPHRQFMLRYMLEKQQQERHQWLATLKALRALEKQLLPEKERLARLRDEKKLLQDEAKQRLRSKQALVNKVRHDVALKKQREKALKQQEAALLQLLKGLKTDLLTSDKHIQHISVRQRKGKLSWPIKGKLVAKFGSRLRAQRGKLRGVQIAPNTKKEDSRRVKAMAEGQVRYADWFGGFGLMMIVEYGDGVMAIYAHNDALYKQLGDWVEAGDVLAEAGSTGWIEKTRLYFEIRDKGVAVNPAHWCR